MAVARDWGEREWGVVTQWEWSFTFASGKVLETDYTTLQIYLTLSKCEPKKVRKVKFILCILYHN